MVTRREMMKALAVGSIAAVPNLLGAIDLAQAASENKPGIESKTIKVTTLMEQPLPGMGDKVATAVLVDLPPGVTDKPHRHPGPIFVYVLEGSVESQVDPEPVTTYKKGDIWYEPPLHVHRLARSASKRKPARVLALLIHDKNEPIVLPPA